MAGVIVLKIESTAQTTSFRYPRIQVGRLPTFDMPPPATIYGHLAGVLGEWFEPKDLKFAYMFRHAGKAVDLETIHPIERGSGRLTLAKRGWPFPINVQCDANVQRREFLLKPSLTLYLRSSDVDLLRRFQDSFLSPYYGYIIVGSQDLATCSSSQLVELDSSENAYFAHTLLPFEWRRWVSPGITVLLPSVIDYTRRRLAIQERYLQVTQPPLRLFNGTEDVTSRQELPDTFLIDPSDARDFGGQKLTRGLWFWPVRGPVVPDSLAEVRHRMPDLGLWAKSSGQLLIDHLIDVCQQAGSFLRIYEPSWPIEDGADIDRIVAYSSLLHDFGKIHPAFQEALRDGPKFNNRHEILGLAFLEWLEIPANEYGWIAAAIATHHKEWFDLRGRFVDADSQHTDLGRLCRGISKGASQLLYEILSQAAPVFSSPKWPHFEVYRLRAFGPIDYGTSILRALAAVHGLVQQMKPRDGIRPGRSGSRDWRPVLAAIHARGWLLRACQEISRTSVDGFVLYWCWCHKAISSADSIHCRPSWTSG
jgi:CRISPR-associated protein Cas5t